MARRTRRLAPWVLLALPLLLACEGGDPGDILGPRNLCTPLQRYAEHHVVDGAAVGAPGPCDGSAVLLENGTYRMWLGCGTEIRLATSTDGRSWSDQGPVLVGTLPWNSAGVSSPTVVKVGVTYHMWFTGSDGADTLRVGHASSLDGTSWAVSACPVVKEAKDPYVIRENNRFVMWYADQRAPHGIRIASIGNPEPSCQSCVTRSCITGTQVMVPEVAWETGGLGGPTVVRIGDDYHMWYHASAGPGAPTRIGYARSPNGFAWVKCNENPVLQPGPESWESGEVAAPELLLTQGEVRVIYSAGPAAGTAGTSFGYTVALDPCIVGRCP